VDHPEVYAADTEALQMSTQDVFSAYGYRSYDQTTRDRVDDLGLNLAGQPARVLFMDVNRYGPVGVLPSPATNHKERVTVLGFVDGHAATVDNSGRHFTASEADYAAFPALTLARFDQLVVNADWAKGRELAGRRCCRGAP
jgi:hypothetical protein